MPVSSHEIETDPFIEEDWLLPHCLSEKLGRMNVDLHKERKDFAMFPQDRKYHPAL